MHERDGGRHMKMSLTVALITSTLKEERWFLVGGRSRRHWTMSIRPCFTRDCLLPLAHTHTHTQPALASHCMHAPLTGIFGPSQVVTEWYVHIHRGISAGNRRNNIMGYKYTPLKRPLLSCERASHRQTEDSL